MECLKNMNVWSVVAEQAIVKRDSALLIESLSNLNKWEYAKPPLLSSSSEIESLMNSNDLPSNSNSNSNRSIESSLLSMQLHILKNQPDQIQSSYREVESLLIEAYREILSIPQERRLQIQSQQFYTMNLLAKLGDRSRASTLIMTHLRKIPKGRSDSVVDHINLLRVRQSLYWKLEEKEASNLSTIMSDFEWTTIQIAQQFLEEGDYASTLETLISASHRNRISTHFVQEMGSIVAKLSSSNLFQSDVRADIQNHLTYNFDCFGSSERSALLSSLAISKLKTANKSNMSKFYEEVYSLLHSAVSADSENKQAWHELSSLLFSLLVQRNLTKMDLPFVTPEYLVATIISALRLDCTNTSLLFWLFYSINNHQKTLSEKILKLLESIPLHAFIPYLYYLFIPRSPLILVTHRLMHSLLSVYPELTCFYLEWNQSFISMNFGPLFSFLPDRVKCDVVCSRINALIVVKSPSHKAQIQQRSRTRLCRIQTRELRNHKQNSLLHSMSYSGPRKHSEAASRIV